MNPNSNSISNSYDLFDVTVRLLTPMHMGNGRELLHEYDYAIRNEQTWRINENAFLETMNADDPQLMTTPPADLLNPGNFVAESNFFRYTIQGTPRSNAHGAQLREQIKTPFDQPYLPGTVLKGALRTALAWHGWEVKGLKPDLAKLNGNGNHRPNPAFAAQTYEKILFGQNPNKGESLLRALHVSDSAPVDVAQLMVLNVSVLSGNGALAAPIEMEALKSETTFKATVKIDRALFGAWARQHGLHLQHEDWLTQLATITHAHAVQRIQSELAWYEGDAATPQPAAIYHKLKQAATKAQPTQCLVQLGWGTGWGSKTFGSRLQQDQGFMERVIGDYRMARDNRRAGDAFPSSRRISVDMAQTALYPLGWAWLSFRRRDQKNG